MSIHLTHPLFFSFPLPQHLPAGYIRMCVCVIEYTRGVRRDGGRMVWSGGRGGEGVIEEGGQFKECAWKKKSRRNTSMQYHIIYLYSSLPSLLPLPLLLIFYNYLNPNPNSYYHPFCSSTSAGRTPFTLHVYMHKGTFSHGSLGFVVIWYDMIWPEPLSRVHASTVVERMSGYNWENEWVALWIYEFV